MHKRLSILFLHLLILCSCKTDPDILESEKLNIISGDSLCSPLYFFYGQYYNLETLKQDTALKNPATHFKLCDKYKNYLPLTYADKATNDSDLAVTYPNGTCFQLSRDSLFYVINANGRYKFTQLFSRTSGEGDSYTNLIKFENGPILIIDDYKNYTFKKYSRNGVEEYSVTVSNSVYSKERGFDRELYYAGKTSKELIFAPSFFESRIHKTMVLNVETGLITYYPYMASGIIKDEPNKKLTGFIVRDDSILTIKILQSNKEYKIKYEKYFGDVFKTQLCGDLLLIAMYDPASTGTGLKCFNLKKGKLNWDAKVGQIRADHSEYYNSLYLSLYKNKVILEDIQTSGNYLQIFDLNSGKRLAVFGSLAFYETFWSDEI